jgi:hypothetical protein
MVRIGRIELPLGDWQPPVLPLNYIRFGTNNTITASTISTVLLVRPEGIEPPTLCSEDRCSNPLSYGRMAGQLLNTTAELGERLMAY